jgi:CheY-like chemotaxis protein
MSARPLRILVADKDLDVRTTIDRITRGHGHLYEGVVDGATCLNKLDQHDYDILFLDLFIPGMDGAELLRRVRAKTPVTSVILLSSLDEPDIIHGLLQQGARAFLIKPVNEAIITDVISRISAGTISQDLTPGAAPDDRAEPGC